MHWNPLSEYPDTAPDVLFWIQDDDASFPVFGRWDENEDCIWDTNDFGFTGRIVGWTEFSPPEPIDQRSNPNV